MQTVLQKPTDLELHGLQMQGISEFSRTRLKSLLQSIFNKMCFLLLSLLQCFYIYIKTVLNENSVDSDQKRFVTSDLGLHCLQMSLLCFISKTFICYCQITNYALTIWKVCSKLSKYKTFTFVVEVCVRAWVRACVRECVCVYTYPSFHRHNTKGNVCTECKCTTSSKSCKE